MLTLAAGVGEDCRRGMSQSFIISDGWKVTGLGAAPWNTIQRRLRENKEVGCLLIQLVLCSNLSQQFIIIH